MAIVRKKSKDNSVLAFDGELTIYTVTQIKDEFFAEQDDLAGKILFDLHAVTEMDTAGVQLLLFLKKFFVSGSRKVSISKTNELVDAVFSTLDINSHFAQDH